MHVPMRVGRLMIAAALGAVFALFNTIGEAYFKLMTTPAWTIFVITASAVVLSVTAFGYRSAVKMTITFTAVNMGLGGVMTALYSIIGHFTPDSEITQNKTSDTATSPILFLFIIAISGAVSLIYTVHREKVMSKRQINVQMNAFGIKSELTLLCDSGNLLRDPFFKKPVLIISAECADGKLPRQIIEAACATDKVAELPHKFAHRIRLIPASSLMGNGMLLGFVPEKLLIDEHPIDAVVAIDASNRDFGGCCGIIPQALLT